MRRGRFEKEFLVRRVAQQRADVLFHEPRVLLREARMAQQRLQERDVGGRAFDLEFAQRAPGFVRGFGKRVRGVCTISFASSES
jgi:hypothetical protein